jgi:hypothetical protein
MADNLMLLITLTWLHDNCSHHRNADRSKKRTRLQVGITVAGSQLVNHSWWKIPDSQLFYTLPRITPTSVNYWINQYVFHAGWKRGAAKAQGPLLPQMGALYCRCVACKYNAVVSKACAHVHRVMDLFPRSTLVIVHTKSFTHTHTLKCMDACYAYQKRGTWVPKKACRNLLQMKASRQTHVCLQTFKCTVLTSRLPSRLPMFSHSSGPRY